MLYDAVILQWNKWTNNYPLDMDQITMRDKLWVILKPTTRIVMRLPNIFSNLEKKETGLSKVARLLFTFMSQMKYTMTCLRKENLLMNGHQRILEDKPTALLLIGNY